MTLNTRAHEAPMLVRLQIGNLPLFPSYSSPDVAIRTLTSNLAEALKQPVPQVNLKFLGGSLQLEHMEALQKSLHERLPETQISLSFERTHFSPEAIAALASLLTLNWNITSLSLKAVQPAPEFLNQLAAEMTTLKQRIRLKSLAITNMGLTNDALRSVIQIANQSPIIHSIDLRGNSFDADIGTILARAEYEKCRVYMPMHFILDRDSAVDNARRLAMRVFHSERLEAWLTPANVAKFASLPRWNPGPGTKFTLDSYRQIATLTQEGADLRPGVRSHSTQAVSKLMLYEDDRIGGPRCNPGTRFLWGERHISFGLTQFLQSAAVESIYKRAQASDDPHMQAVGNTLELLCAEPNSILTLPNDSPATPYGYAKVTAQLLFPKSYLAIRTLELPRLGSEAQSDYRVTHDAYAIEEAGLPPDREAECAAFGGPEGTLHAALATLANTQVNT